MLNMIKQKFDGCEINEFFSRFIGAFIVSCESSETVKPSENHFHNPSERLRCKPVSSVGIDLYISISMLKSLLIPSTS